MEFRGRRPGIALLVVLAALVGAAAGAAPARAAHSYRFAPYADMADYPPPNLPALGTAAKVRAVSLGFITAKAGTKCAPTWGGYAEYGAAGKRAYRRADVRAFKRAGGAIVVSFGGQAGAELATVCPSVARLTAAYRKVIAAYGATHVDFDVEGAAIADKGANTRRARAIRALQRAKRKLVVSFTLPVLPSGLDANGLALLRNARRHHVAVALVNGMAMDYGEAAAPRPAGKMATYAFSAGRGIARQLRRLHPGLSAAAARRRVGLTPMIGVNDVQSEVFTLADAGALVAWAQDHHIGRIGMWSVGRDRQCTTPTVTAQTNCSSVAQAPWAFSSTFRKFTG